MLFRRKELPWEVVDSRNVDPVPMYYDDEGKRYQLFIPTRILSTFTELDLVFVKGGNVRRTYVVEVKREAFKKDSGMLPKTVTFAREQLFEEVKKNGYNVLLLER